MKQTLLVLALVAVVCWAAALVTAPTDTAGPPLATDGPDQAVIFVPGMT